MTSLIKKKAQIRLNLEVSSFYKRKARGRNRLKGILIGSSLLGIDPQSSSSAQAKKMSSSHLEIRADKCKESPQQIISGSEPWTSMFNEPESGLPA